MILILYIVLHLNIQFTDIPYLILRDQNIIYLKKIFKTKQILKVDSFGSYFVSFCQIHRVKPKCNHINIPKL